MRWYGLMWLALALAMAVARPAAAQMEEAQYTNWEMVVYTCDKYWNGVMNSLFWYRKPAFQCALDLDNCQGNLGRMINVSGNNLVNYATASAGRTVHVQQRDGCRAELQQAYAQTNAKQASLDVCVEDRKECHGALQKETRGRATAEANATHWKGQAAHREGVAMVRGEQIEKRTRGEA